MARLIYAVRALDDLERLSDFLLDVDPVAARATIDLIAEAVDVLANHPLVGRPVEAGLRELIISRGSTGYVALYSFESTAETVLILSIRHQREAGLRTE